MILDTILEEKRVDVAYRKVQTPMAELRARIQDTPQPRDFSAGLVRSASGVPAVIAEVKKASPSKGLIRPHFEPVSIAQSYEAAGAAAISVLTDEKFFQGSLDYLMMVREAVALPLLRKDFLIDDYQVYEARSAGADAVLLIVAALTADTLSHLMGLAGGLGMQCLVETHDEREMETALGAGASLIGINNRNLYTFEVSLDATGRLASMARGAGSQTPGEASGIADPGQLSAGQPSAGQPRLVSESGIFTRADMEAIGAMGADAVLIGEALMRELDIEAKLRELIG